MRSLVCFLPPRGRCSLRVEPGGSENCSGGVEASSSPCPALPYPTKKPCRESWASRKFAMPPRVMSNPVIADCNSVIGSWLRYMIELLEPLYCLGLPSGKHYQTQSSPPSTTRETTCNSHHGKGGNSRPSNIRRVVFPLTSCLSRKSELFTRTTFHGDCRTDEARIRSATDQSFLRD